MVKRVSDEVWAYLKVVWTSEVKISLKKAEEELISVFGFDKSPRKSAIDNYLKKNNVIKGSAVAITSSELNSKKEAVNLISACNELSNDVRKRFNEISVSAEEKVSIITRHRSNVDCINKVSDRVVNQVIKTLDVNSELQDLLSDRALNATEIKTKGVDLARGMRLVSLMSSTLSILAQTQKSLASQEFALCGITEEDFKQSEHEKRLEDIAMLGDVYEQETIARHALQASLSVRQDWIAGENVDVSELLVQAAIFDDND